MAWVSEEHALGPPVVWQSLACCNNPGTSACNDMPAAVLFLTAYVYWLMYKKVAKDSKEHASERASRHER